MHLFIADTSLWRTPFMGTNGVRYKEVPWYCRPLMFRYGVDHSLPWKRHSLDSQRNLPNALKCYHLVFQKASWYSIVFENSEQCNIAIAPSRWRSWCWRVKAQLLSIKIDLFQEYFNQVFGTDIFRDVRNEYVIDEWDLCQRISITRWLTRFHSKAVTGIYGLAIKYFIDTFLRTPCPSALLQDFFNYSPVSSCRGSGVGILHLDFVVRITSHKKRSL